VYLANTVSRFKGRFGLDMKAICDLFQRERRRYLILRLDPETRRVTAVIPGTNGEINVALSRGVLPPAGAGNQLREQYLVLIGQLRSARSGSPIFPLAVPLRAPRSATRNSSESPESWPMGKYLPQRHALTSAVALTSTTSHTNLHAVFLPVAFNSMRTLAPAPERYGGSSRPRREEQIAAGLRGWRPWQFRFGPIGSWLPQTHKELANKIITSDLLGDIFDKRFSYSLDALRLPLTHTAPSFQGRHR
jgi:hypothetical protein